MNKINNYTSENISELAENRTMNFYDAHMLCCSEAILYVFNRGFGGKLTGEEAIRLGSGFCVGVGGSGCICGALAAGVIVLNMYLTNIKKSKLEKIVKGLHDSFKKSHRSTCCRVLIKDVKHNKKMHRQNCMMLTGWAAKEVMELLLKYKPVIKDNADFEFLKSNDSKSDAKKQKIRGSF